MSPAALPRPAPSGGAPLEFKRLYEAELDYVWNSLRRLGVPPAYLEDLVHDTFVTAWRKLGDFDSSRPVRPWLFGIAFRIASDFRNRAFQKREVGGESFEAEDPSQAPDEAVAQSQARALVLKALESIPLERRGVFVMAELDGCAVPEIAQAMGIPLNTAYSRLRLARADFAAAVKRITAQQGGSR